MTIFFFQSENIHFDSLLDSVTVRFCRDIHIFIALLVRGLASSYTIITEKGRQPFSRQVI